jgi:hypothetical protein
MWSGSVFCARFVSVCIRPWLAERLLSGRGGRCPVLVGSVQFFWGVVVNARLQLEVFGVFAMGKGGALERVAERYRRGGYDVLVHPSGSDLPAFLANGQIDILARKGDHLIALEVKEEGASDEESVGVAADLGVDAAIKQIEEAELLLNPRTMRAALVMGWSAFEAAARAILQPGRSALASASPGQMIEELRSRGLVSQEEHTRLQQSLYVRNIVAHGGRPGDLTPDLVPFLLSLARRLLRTAMPQSNIEFRDSVSLTVLRKGVNQLPKLRDRLERATQVLLDLLGRSRNSVSIDWDLAEDARDRPVVVLRLSDPNGTAVATFDPDELEDEIRLRARLNRLWGDLLEIRSHKQVQRLMSSSSPFSPIGPVDAALRYGQDTRRQD